MSGAYNGEKINIMVLRTRLRVIFMKRTIWLWQFFGFAITVLGGTFLHFLYDLTGGNIWTALFSGVNESTWEHMKLLFWPSFVYAVLESFFFKENKCFWCIKLRGILLGLVCIPALFYLYSGVIGKSPDFVNIAIFFISAMVSYVYEARALYREDTTCKSGWRAFFILCIIAFTFILFTFITPRLNIFKDPVTGAYGITAV